MSQVMAWLRVNRGYILPASLGLFNIVLAGLWFAVLTPKLDSLDLELRKLGVANVSLGNQVEATSLALETIDENRDRYNALSKRGFIDPQNRLGAVKLLDRLRELHGLTSIYYEVAPEALYDDQVTRATGFNIVSTRVIITMRGLFDADLLEFTQAIIDDFPGQIRPISLSLEKLAVPTEATLGLLREGKLVDFVGGELTFEWNTLRPVARKTSG